MGLCGSGSKLMTHPGDVKSIRQILEAGVAAAPEQTIVHPDGSRYTYRGLRERIVALASALAEWGIGEGSTVGVMDWDSHRYLETYFTIPMIGGTLHTINVRLSPEQILYTINHAKDDAIIVAGEFMPLLQQVWDRIDDAPALIAIRENIDAAQDLLPIAAEYEALIAAGDPAFDIPDVDESARATIFYTTGTTGLPKGVFFSGHQLVRHTLALRDTLLNAPHCGLAPNDVYMPLTPMFHVHAWGFPYLATLLGLKQVYPGHSNADALVDLIASEQVTISHCVPTVLQMIIAAAKDDGALRGWKVIIGGASFPKSLCRDALGRGIDAIAGYGMSESCPVLTLSHLRPGFEAMTLDRQIEVRTMAGRPVPPVEIRTVDPQMNDVIPDGMTEGEIVARAPWLTQGYLRDPANSEKLWRGGWLHTGDVGIIDADGYLRITDRIKDVIKTGGEWVSSLEVEDLILQDSRITGAAVIGVPDPKWTERPLAIVVFKDGCSASEDEIRQRLLDYAREGMMSRCAVPDRVLVRPALPRTSIGKVDKKLLRRQISSDCVS